MLALRLHHQHWFSREPRASALTRGSRLNVIAWVLCAAFLALPPSAAAALDPEVNKPYHLKIVLRVAKHRLLTPVFKDQLQRELRDSLQAGFGALAQVEVVEKHPLLNEIEAKGLQPALDGWKEVSGTKTHFVLLDFADGQYEIQAAQHDGHTGLASPVRRSRTADRQFVARTVALLIDRDFGLVGTVEGKGPEVKVTLKGSGLGVPLDRWVGRDEVFSIARLERSGQAQQAVREPWALLQVNDGPKDGCCRCTLFRRYRDTLAGGPGVLGYRCLKLGTTRGPLRLRVVDQETQAPLAGIQVSVAAHGFQGEGKQQGATGPDGLLPERRDLTYHHVAFVRIFSGGSAIAQVPVEILDDRIIVCHVSIDAKTDALGQLDLRRKRWLTRLYDTLLVQAELSKRLGFLMGKALHEAALAEAKAGLQGLRGELAELEAERAALGAAAKAGLSLAEGEQRLQDIRTWEKKLLAAVENLEEVLRQKTDLKRKESQALIAQARAFEDQAEYGQALALYDKALALAAADAKVTQHVQQLKKAWQLKGEAHGKARQFVYDVWPKLASSRAIQDQLRRAWDAYRSCREAGDSLTIEKLLLVAIAHTSTLQKELEPLKGQDGEDARDRIRTIETVAADLEKLLKEGSEYLQSLKPSGK